NILAFSKESAQRTYGNDDTMKAEPLVYWHVWRNECFLAVLWLINRCLAATHKVLLHITSSDIRDTLNPKLGLMRLAVVDRHLHLQQAAAIQLHPHAHLCGVRPASLWERDTHLTQPHAARKVRRVTLIHLDAQIWLTGALWRVVACFRPLFEREPCRQDR